MRVLLPRNLVGIDPKYGPLFFLAGPVRGGGDWQAQCCDELLSIVPHFYVAIPCRYPDTHRLMRYRVGFSETVFNRQLTWERHYLDLAGCGDTVENDGCILFWLPKESTLEPHPGPEPYAMDTRGELGEWRGRLMHKPNLRVVVGAEEGFLGLSQIQRNFGFATNSDFPIYPTLRETVQAAVQKARHV